MIIKRIAAIFLVAGLAAPLAALLGISRAWGEAGDDAYAAFMLGNYKRALDVARPAALEGDFLAQFTLGRIYEEVKQRPKYLVAKRLGTGLIHKEPIQTSGEHS